MSFFVHLSPWLAEKDIQLIGTHTLKTNTVLLGAEKKAIASANHRRQTEFATGRWCARKACAKLGLASQPIVSGEEGESLWPSGICGSISHTSGAYCAAVAFSRQYRSLGIDLESMRRKISLDALALILNKDELKWLDCTGPKKGEYEKHIFCAKESIFKMLSPLIKKSFSFSSISLLPPMEEGFLSILLNENLNHEFRKGAKYPGIYFSNHDWIFTLCYLKP